MFTMRTETQKHHVSFSEANMSERTMFRPWLAINQSYWRASGARCCCYITVLAFLIAPCGHSGCSSAKVTQARFKRSACASWIFKCGSNRPESCHFMNYCTVPYHPFTRLRAECWRKDLKHSSAAAFWHFAGVLQHKYLIHWNTEKENSSRSTHNMQMHILIFRCWLAIHQYYWQASRNPEPLNWKCPAEHTALWDVGAWGLTDADTEDRLHLSGREDKGGTHFPEPCFVDQFWENMVMNVYGWICFQPGLACGRSNESVRLQNR